MIDELSEMDFVQRYQMIPMERIGDIFRAGIPATGRVPGVRVFLQVTAVESQPRVRPLLQSAKVSTPARIETLKQFALPGIATELMPSAPPELPGGQTGSFFRLKLEEGTEWGSNVVPGGALAAFLLGAPQDVKLTLIVIFPVG